VTAAPIAFRSNPGKYSFTGTAQLVNAYAEQMGPDAKAPLAVLPCEGLVEFADTEAETPCRGLIYLEDLDKLYSVHSSGAWMTNSAGVSVRIGTVPGTDIVQMSRNQKTDPQIVVKADAGLQVIESDSLSYILDEDLVDEGDTITADYVGGYHVYGLEDRRFFISNLNSAKLIDNLDFATFEQRGGKLVRVIEDNGELIGLCSSWMEFWRDTGNADFPFEPIGFKSRGCKATNAVVRCDNTIMFPGDDNNIHKLANYNPQVISSHEVSRLIQEDASASSMVGFAWDRGGHSFANFTGTDWSRCYDAATQTWHARESYGQSTWRAQHAVRAFGKTIVGDKLSGKLFYLDADTYTEDGGTMVWSVISPTLHVFPNGGILDAVHFDLATGYGTLSGQGSDPKVMLQISTDGGNTFGGYRELELGLTGDYKARVTARRLGRFGPKGIVFKLSISDPVVRALVASDVELRPLKR
jgi:hypothetical protein